MRRVIGIVLLLCHVSPLLASGPMIREFPAAQEAAARLNLPLVVCVHGASWQRASRTFLDDVWQSSALRRELRERIVLAEIGIGQNLDEDAKKQQAERTRHWNSKTVRTFPALQLYSPDKRLLRTISGNDFYAIWDSPELVAAELNTLAQAVVQRQQLVTALRSLQQRPAEFVRLFERLQQLPLDPQADDLAMLKAVDPDDTFGLVEPLGFTGWEFVRQTTADLADGVDEEAVVTLDRMLANERYRPSQQCLIWCAKGMVLAAAGRPEAAWEAYRSGFLVDPEGPNGRAVLRHGHRTVGKSLRVGPSPDAPLTARLTGGSLTADGKAVFTLSSRDPVHDDPQKHASLFAGPLQDFAFHTESESGPWVAVDLGEVCRVEAVEVSNRNPHSDRAAGLTLRVSADGRTWKQCWQADTVAAEWLIDLTGSAAGYEPARFLKLGLPPTTSGILHLRAVNVYGLRPGDEPRPALIGAVADRSPEARVRHAISGDRLDVEKLLVSLREIAGDPESQLLRDCDGEIAVLERYGGKRLWRSRDGKSVMARLLAVGAGEVTLEYEGLPTPIERGRFSRGSERQLSQVEEAAQAIAQRMASGDHGK